MAPSSWPSPSPTGADSTKPRRSSSTRAFIDPGSPWQNAWVGSHNGRMRDEYLNGQLFEAKVLNEAWRIDYNMNRPHSAYGWKAPAAFAAEWSITQQLALALTVGSGNGSRSAHSANFQESWVLYRSWQRVGLWRVQSADR